MKKVFAVGVFLVGVIGILFVSSVSVVAGEYGCCQLTYGCISGDLIPSGCDGTWHSGWTCYDCGEGYTAKCCPPDQWCEEGECVPEASTLVLFSIGLLSLAGYLGLRRKEK